MKNRSWETNEEIAIFREYLQIPSVHPNVNYELCVQFLQRQAQSLNLPFSTFTPVQNKPIVVITWHGTQPQLPSILLNSHMDVVPVFEEQWTYPPFAAIVNDNGHIFARGAQDMKCCGTWYLGAIRALLKNQQKLKRTIHIVFVPDEEIGSDDGWMKFVDTPEFQQLNVGFALDEGCAEIGNYFPYFYAERVNRCVQYNCHGSTGHGSYFYENAAGTKVRYLIDKFMDFQQKEMIRLKENLNLSIGDVTTINLTLINGGTQQNILPKTISLVFDVRIALDVNLAEFENQLKRWGQEAGENVEITFLENKPKIPGTPIDNSNPFVVTFKETLVKQLKYEIKPFICPARTDANILRQAGIPTIGFSPMKNTPLLLHGNDEYISVDTYLTGLTIYEQLIFNLGNV